MAAIEPNARILDIATGTGAMLLAAAERAGRGATLIGIDLSVPMLQRARDATKAAGLDNVELRVMDAQDLQFADESFDCVLCGFALGSIPDPARALSEMRRTLRPAGRLASSTQGAGSFSTIHAGPGKRTCSDEPASHSCPTTPGGRLRTRPPCCA